MRFAVVSHSLEFNPGASTAVDASAAFQNDYFSSTIGEKTRATEPVTFASAAVSDSPAGLSAAAWSQVSAMVSEGKEINVSTPGDGQVPDFIVGADGNLTANPAKTSPNPDGSVTIQMEGKDMGSLQAAKELKIAVIQEKIRYWQMANPNETNVPHYLQSMLASAQSAPVGGDSQPQRRPEAATQPRPQAQEVASAPRPQAASYSPSSGGGERLGNANIGSAPTSRFRDGSLDSSGPIDRSAIPRPVEGDLAIKGPPSANPEQIQTFLEKMGSPAAKEAGFSQALYNACTERGIDPAVAVGFFLQESTCGRYGRGHENKSLGNIKGRAPESGGTDGTFRRYDTWAEGARDWARLIDEAYVGKRGFTHLSQVIGVYAPSSDGNNENKYVATVKGVVENFKKQNGNTAMA